MAKAMRVLYGQGTLEIEMTLTFPQGSNTILLRLIIPIIGQVTQKGRLVARPRNFGIGESSLRLFKSSEAIEEHSARLARQHTATRIAPILVNPIFGAVISGTSARIFDLNFVHD